MVEYVVRVVVEDHRLPEVIRLLTQADAGRVVLDPVGQQGPPVAAATAALALEAPRPNGARKTVHLDEVAASMQVEEAPPKHKRQRFGPRQNHAHLAILNYAATHKRPFRTAAVAAVLAKIGLSPKSAAPRIRELTAKGKLMQTGGAPHPGYTYMLAAASVQAPPSSLWAQLMAWATPGKIFTTREAFEALPRKGAKVNQMSVRIANLVTDGKLVRAGMTKVGSSNGRGLTLYTRAPDA